MSPQIVRNLPPRKRGGRTGYPPLILGQHVFTKILVEIACAEPTWTSGLPETALTHKGNTGPIVRRLAREGLVRRYEGRAPGARTSSNRQLWLDRRRPYSAELYEVLLAIGQSNGLNPPRARRGPPNDLCAIAEDHDAEKQPEHLFGTKQRTTAIVLIHLVPRIDAVTVARVAGMNENESALHLFLRERIAVSEVTGAFRLYSANPDLPWAPELDRLVRRLAQIVPRYASMAAAAETLRMSGMNPARKYLRSKMAREHAPPKR